MVSGLCPRTPLAVRVFSFACLVASRRVRNRNTYRMQTVRGQYPPSWWQYPPSAACLYFALRETALGLLRPAAPVLPWPACLGSVNPICSTGRVEAHVQCNKSNQHSRIHQQVNVTCTTTLPALTQRDDIKLLVGVAGIACR